MRMYEREASHVVMGQLCSAVLSFGQEQTWRGFQMKRGLPELFLHAGGLALLPALKLVVIAIAASKPELRALFLWGIKVPLQSVILTATSLHGQRASGYRDRKNNLLDYHPYLKSRTRMFFFFSIHILNRKSSLKNVSNCLLVRPIVSADKVQGADTPFALIT